MSADESLLILKRMYTDKGRATIGFVIMVGAADGDFDQAAFAMIIAKTLGVA